MVSERIYIFLDEVKWDSGSQRDVKLFNRELELKSNRKKL